MVIRIYDSFDLLSIGKYCYCVRVASPDTFDFSKVIEVMRCLYGSDKIIEIIVV